MQYGTTSGDIIITIPNCVCGLTSGCEKCQPIVIPKFTNVYITLPTKPSIPYLNDPHFYQELKDNPNPPPEPKKPLTPDSIDFKR